MYATKKDKESLAAAVGNGMQLTSGPPMLKPNNFPSYDHSVHEVMRIADLTDYP